MVGVLPPGEPWLDSAEIFVPMVRDPSAERTGFYLTVIGRLKPGFTIEAARADLERVALGLEEQYPEAAAGIGVTLASSSEWVADAGAFARSRLMTQLLFGIASSDPATYAAAALVTAVTPLLSCYVPALRALRVDPATVLREE